MDIRSFFGKKKGGGGGADPKPKPKPKPKKPELKPKPKPKKPEPESKKSRRSPPASSSSSLSKKTASVASGGGDASPQNAPPSSSGRVRNGVSGENKGDEDDEKKGRRLENDDDSDATTDFEDDDAAVIVEKVDAQEKKTKASTGDTLERGSKKRDTKSDVDSPQSSSPPRRTSSRRKCKGPSPNYNDGDGDGDNKGDIDRGGRSGGRSGGREVSKHSKRKIVIDDSDDDDFGDSGDGNRDDVIVVDSDGDDDGDDDFRVDKIEEGVDDDDDDAFDVDTDEDDVAPAKHGRNRGKGKETSAPPSKKKARLSSGDGGGSASKPKPKAETPKKRSPKKAINKASEKPQKPPRYRPADASDDEVSYSGASLRRLFDSAPPLCLSNLTMVFTGLFPNLGRDEGIDAMKILGARVTTAVSSRTDYLVLGSEGLEDGRAVEEGSKYRKATELGDDKNGGRVVDILRGEKELVGLVRFMAKHVGGDICDGGDSDVEMTETPSIARGSAAAGKEAVPSDRSASATPSPAVSNPYASKKRVTNPYAKAVSNPYSKSTASGNGGGSAPSRTNPYAKSPSAARASPSPSSTGGGGGFGGGRADVGDSSALWADKYAPGSSKEILGNSDAVKKLFKWLDGWENQFNNSNKQVKSLSGPHGPWKAALLSGPPGIGKTTTATLVARESGRDLFELNASDTRSKKALTENLGDVIGTRVLSFGVEGGKKSSSGGSGIKRRCIIMDEVDGIGAGDRNGMSELIQMIKKTKVPIVCICNDRSSQKMRSLVQYCMDLRFRRPMKTVIARRAVEVGRREGMNVEVNAAEAIADSCGNDIRQVLNCLQMWSSRKLGVDVTYRDLKDRQSSINKDEVLRVSMFDATKLIVEGSRGMAGADNRAVTNSLFKRSDAYFVDYMLMGLNVHQNYLKVTAGQFNKVKAQGDAEAEATVLNQMHDATHAMSDFALVENQLRGGDQNWALLPLCAMLTVKAGHHGGGPNGGFLPGYPEFAGWLGKNSSRNKKIRLLQELQHHMNYKISADGSELRLSYMPIIRERFHNLLFDKEGPRVEDAIKLMDEYGLDRDDIFENLDEFTLDPKAKKFSDLDSKSKASFTRIYNQTAHKAQALVAEQGAGKTTKKKSASEAVSEGGELDVVNDDKVEEEVEEDEDDIEALKSLFKKKGRAKGKGGVAAKAKGSTKRGKKK